MEKINNEWSKKTKTEDWIHKNSFKKISVKDKSFNQSESNVDSIIYVEKTTKVVSSEKDKHEIVVNKLTRKEKYENDLKFQEEQITLRESKIVVEANFFKRIWLKFCLSLFLFWNKKHFKIKHAFYIRSVNKRKDKTIKMAGDVWYRRIGSNLSNYTVLIIMLIAMIFPFYWMLITSFKPYSEVDTGVMESLWPKHWTLQAYKDMFTFVNNSGGRESIPFSRFFFNSLFIALVSTLVQLSVSVIGGFAIYNWRTKFNSLFMIIMFSIMMVPGEAMLLGRYWIAVQMQWRDTLFALIVPFIGNVFTIYLMSNAFYGLNRDLKRAAKVDGLSSFQYFMKIALPAVSATILTSFIISFIESWNSVLWPITVIDNQSGQWRTIPMLLYSLMNVSGMTSEEFPIADPINVKMAASILAILPMIIVFIVFNKWIINGLTKRSVGGTKG
ncbi:sn-glycerol-3-phosphate ABC transporter permease component [Mesoplasma florum L1]|uniref:Sn-glycerol-3-phosphate ABC transporter permease component n=1 Tax=Mesoplasma florum (strain ATCC 33453 / NBRC 100688 / NCTC 11704 / L1) TaxID=265311 RepID=Q6F291_MESFL|nr:carbohydrate ABC transporter permease [Mesoplasma florum]AAT75382.1 sn-glycerol-3-phosphate ABC transporter permease component [Mesoplasma florum L1]ATI72983.1 carbohydrate ABC transporter permease [Mesoplasma florum]ATI73674.1 carbohydrate ABC transporter permease [Mesoplasma florum]AVN61386.1 carbohydrate ABC transporter permease [Mesoplasma florum]